jgi:hypothetical protein
VSRRRRGGHALAVFALLALTYGQFFQAATWGAACRFDLARALAERGTVCIDAYHENTGDKAFFAGHYYSDKGPLPSYLAAPAITAARAIRAATGRPASEATWLALAAGLAALLASGLPTAAAGALFVLVLRARGVPAPLAAGSALLAYLGTTLFPYATVLQGHALVAAWVLLFFHACFPARGAPSARASLLAGVAASGALATDVLAAPALAILGVLSLLRHKGVAGRHALLALAGAAPGLALLGVYQSAAFGSPLSFGYQHVALPYFQQKMRGGFFGIGPPDARVAASLLFGPYRGLFFACPVLLPSVFGLGLLLRVPRRRVEAIGALLVLAVYVAINAGYSTWHGGWAIGPRHLVVVIPLLALGLPAALARWRRTTGALGALSVLFMLAVTSVQPEVPEDVGDPIFHHALPRFVRGELSVGEQSFADYRPARENPKVPDRHDAFLAGEILGLPGLLALAPILVVWGLLGRRAIAK